MAFKLTVIKYSEFPRQIASSSRSWFHPIACWTTVCCLLQVNLQSLIEVQDGFICVPGLGVLMGHPCDLPSSAASSCMKTAVPVDDLLEATRFFRIKNLFRSANRHYGFNLADPYHCFIRTTCTRGYFTPEINSQDHEISENQATLRTRVFQLPSSGTLCLSPLILAPPPNFSEMCVDVQVTNKTMVVGPWLGNKRACKFKRYRDLVVPHSKCHATMCLLLSFTEH